MLWILTFGAPGPGFPASLLLRQQTKNKCPQDGSCWQWQLGCHLTTKTLAIWGFGKGKYLSASLSAERSYDRKQKHKTQPPSHPQTSGQSIDLQEKVSPVINERHRGVSLFIHWWEDRGTKWAQSSCFVEVSGKTLKESKSVFLKSVRTFEKYRGTKQKGLQWCTG